MLLAFCRSKINDIIAIKSFVVVFLMIFHCEQRYLRDDDYTFAVLVTYHQIAIDKIGLV